MEQVNITEAKGIFPSSIHTAVMAFGLWNRLGSMRGWKHGGTVLDNGWSSQMIIFVQELVWLSITEGHEHGYDHINRLLP